MDTNQKLTAIDEAIVREKRSAAREVYHDAWADGVLEGIDTDILAETAITTVLEETIQEGGEHAALALLEELMDRVKSGDFTLYKTLQ
ncbi:MAG: hypothetical protein AAFR71_10500 [Pseudomonadota bacterium]